MATIISNGNDPFINRISVVLYGKYCIKR